MITNHTINDVGCSNSGCLCESRVYFFAAYADSFVADLCSFGYSEAFARTLVTAASENVVAITFTPEAAFDQTPGPHAGRSLGR